MAVETVTASAWCSVLTALNLDVDSDDGGKQDAQANAAAAYLQQALAVVYVANVLIATSAGQTELSQR